MATDLETGTDQGEIPSPRPSLKITGLHIRGLKSIASLDLPGDGLGWEGSIPDFVMVGGINGSGKTTLLEFLVEAFTQMNCPPPNGQLVEIPRTLRAAEAIIDFWFDHPGLGINSIRFLIGGKTFIQENAKETWFGFQYFGPDVKDRASLVGEQTNNLRVLFYYIQSKANSSNFDSSPRVVYFPSERRNLASPATNFKSASKLIRDFTFVDRWEPPEKWDASLEAHLYSVRWEDLNAKEEGRTSEANGFESYSGAFSRFFEGRKQLKWNRGELVVETKSGDIHDLSDLSSGEKQVILFMGELLHRWRPGSLILIDEPELHLHESYQTKLWESLVHWQEERGGQVILATQSGHLFRISDPGIKVLLSARRSR